LKFTELRRIYSSAGWGGVGGGGSWVHFDYFNVHGSVHPNNILIYIQQMQHYITQFILSRNCSTCFGWSGAPTTVSLISGICHTVTATCRYSGVTNTRCCR
jgi:hypothetical protein